MDNREMKAAILQQAIFGYTHAQAHARTHACTHTDKIIL